MTRERGRAGAWRPRRSEIVVTVAFLLALTGIFVALAVLSYRLLWSEEVVEPSDVIDDRECGEIVKEAVYG